MKKLFSYLLPLTSYLLFLSCEAENEYSTWPCRFAYDNSAHQDATLASAMDVNVPGIFCLITESVRGGVKYLNWIALLNKVENDDAFKEMTDCQRRFGYRLAEPLHYRESFRYVRNGYCAADMACFRNVFKMSMPDVYARREILTLTDFLWQGK